MVAATRGVTASFMKELVRKAALLAALRDGSGSGITVTDEDMQAALRELLEEGSTLTKVLLGAGQPPAGTEWLEAWD